MTIKYVVSGNRHQVTNIRRNCPPNCFSEQWKIYLSTTFKIQSPFLSIMRIIYFPRLFDDCLLCVSYVETGIWWPNQKWHTEFRWIIVQLMMSGICSYTRDLLGYWMVFDWENTELRFSDSGTEYILKKSTFLGYGMYLCMLWSKCM